LLVNLRLKMESSSFSPPIAGRADQDSPTAGLRSPHRPAGALVLRPNV